MPSAAIAINPVCEDAVANPIKFAVTVDRFGRSVKLKCV